MDQLTKARLESRPIELADKVLAAIKLRGFDSGDSLSVAQWQQDVNAAAELRRVVGDFVAGMPREEVLWLIDSIVTAQSIYALPCQTELLQLRSTVARMCELIANAQDNLGDMPISDDWAKDWCERADTLMRSNA